MEKDVQHPSTGDQMSHSRLWSRNRRTAELPLEVRYLRRRLSLTSSKPEAEFILDQSQRASDFWHRCGQPEFHDPTHVNWFLSKCVHRNVVCEWDEADWTVDDRMFLSRIDDALHLSASILSLVPASIGFTGALAAYDGALASLRLRPSDRGYGRFIADQAGAYTKHFMRRDVPPVHDCVSPTDPDKEWRAAAHDRVNDVVARISDMCSIEACGLDLPIEAFRYCVAVAEVGQQGVAWLIQSLNLFWEHNGQPALRGEGDVESLVFAYLRSRLERPHTGEADDEALASAFFDGEILIQFCEYLTDTDVVTSPFCVALANYTSGQHIAKFTRAYVDHRASHFDLIRYLPF